MPFGAKYSKIEVEQREEIIIRYIVALIKDTQRMPTIIPHFLNYGIIDWSWPLRFYKGNEEYRGFRYYSYDAYEAIRRGERRFTRDHIFPKKRLKEILFNVANPDEHSVRQLMEKYGEICVITKKEDDRLRVAGLRNTMPDGWKMGDNIFARYVQVRIGVKVNEDQW